jgi:AhpD family alkylhydroperoxidase
MQARLDVRHVPPGALKVMMGFQTYLSGCSLAPELLDLIYLRASQINGCAYCIDMHTKDLRAGGETEQRLYLLDAWREAPFYSDRERAALAWTEAVTRVTEGHVPDEVYEQARAQFSQEGLANLTLAIVSINSWNRLNIAFKTVAGGYQPPTKEKLAASARK